MVDIIWAWLQDGSHLAFLAGAIAMLYLARHGAHRLLRTSFLVTANALRLIDRWVLVGAGAAMARHNRLAAGMKEAELQPRIPGDARRTGRRIERDLENFLEHQGSDTPATSASLARLAAHVGEHRQVMESYGVQLRDIQATTAPAALRIGHSSGIGLAFAIVLIAAVGIAGWLNFALLERPMAEVVGDSYRVMGVPIYRLAALAIIVLEVAVGLVLLEALSVTTMFPQFERLEQRPGVRAAIIATMATALLVLAVIEAALALTRDEISRLERELMGTLAGAAPTEAGQAVGEMARYAQAAFGLVIPFALAFLGFAIEALIRNGRVVLQLVVGVMLQILSFLVRLLRRLLLGLLEVALALYDLLIFLPLCVERLIGRLMRRARS